MSSAMVVAAVVVLAGVMMLGMAGLAVMLALIVGRLWRKARAARRQSEMWQTGWWQK